MVTPTSSVSIGALLRSRPEVLGLPLELIAGASGLDKRITSPHIQKTGLALAGFDAYLSAGRILILGESEVRYLESLASAARVGALRRTFAHGIPAVMITGGFTAPPELVAESERAGVPLLSTPIVTPIAIAKVHAILEDSLAERTIVHAVLMDILGLGVLIVGESGIGKSECALDLIVRGHRLVADDTVEIRRRAESVLIGTCPDLTRHHMEVRGLGLINIKDLFGVASTRSSKRVELVVQLERWEPGREYERLGLDDAHYEILGLRVPLLRMPVAPGRNVSILVEVAARNQLLRSRGQHAARKLAARLERQLLDPDTAVTDGDSDADRDDHTEGES
jgi:HPr kinase/phosphorylase